MRFRTVVLLLLTLGIVPAVYADGYAQGNGYFGMAASGVNFARTGTLTNTYDSYGYTAELGYGGEFMALEVRVGTGGMSYLDSNGLSLQAQRFSAAYLRLNFPFDEGKVNFYLLGGYASVNVKGTLSGASATATFNGPSYGAGLELYGSRTAALYVEYVSYLNQQKFTNATLGLAGDKFDIRSTSLGIVFHF